jgi:hypothetical protein
LARAPICGLASSVNGARFHHFPQRPRIAFFYRREEGTGGQVSKGGAKDKQGTNEIVQVLPEKDVDTTSFCPDGEGKLFRSSHVTP